MKRLLTTRPWTIFAWLVLVAVVYHYAGHMAVLLGFLFWAAIMGWLAFCRRFPRTAFFVFGLVQGLTGGRQYRRHWY